MATRVGSMQIQVGERLFRVISWDRAMTIGVVKDETNQDVCGWSRDDSSDQVHVLGKLGGEWRGEGLEKTLRNALSEVLR